MNFNFGEELNNLMDKVKENKRSLVIIAGAVLFVGIILLLVFPKMQAAIRASEINSIVSQEQLEKKAFYLNVQQADQEISEKTAITVLFSAPEGDTYDTIISVLKNETKMSAFNHTIYIYPIVYNASEIETKYGIKKDQSTIIFFEDGKEKNRLTIDNSFEIQSMLIPALNQLPLSTS